MEIRLKHTGLRPRTKVLSGVAAAVIAVGLLAGYAYFRYVDVVRYTAEHGRITVDQAEVGDLGRVLVTNKGFALYMFPPDAAREVSCTGGCARSWPPLRLRTGQTVIAGPGVRAELLATLPNPGGDRIVTYNGWPLYTYLGDADPGHATGQGEYDDGGDWYTMHPSGQIVRN
jgi:predicted lipoprotein with Yx(FWY)xxD motif